MFSAVREELIAGCNKLLSRDCALGLSGNEFRVVFPDQFHELAREGVKLSEQITIARFEAFSFATILKKGKVHWAPPSARGASRSQRFRRLLGI
jgi:hypothetical protein